MTRAYERAMSMTLGHEGGHSHNAYDSGGDTMFGVTEAVARRYGYQGAMRDMPKRLAVEIGRIAYWKPLHLDAVAELSFPIAAEMFDTGYNAGTRRAATFLQRALNVLNRSHRARPDYPELVADGLMGPKTLAALEAFLKKRGKDGERVMVRLLDCLQGAFYTELCERREKDEEFMFGWIRQRIGNAATEE